MTEAIKIAVRVRPFNEKEIEQKQALCVEMVGLSFIRSFNSALPNLSSLFFIRLIQK